MRTLYFRTKMEQKSAQRKYCFKHSYKQIRSNKVNN